MHVFFLLNACVCAGVSMHWQSTLRSKPSLLDSASSWNCDLKLHHLSVYGWRNSGFNHQSHFSLFSTSLFIWCRCAVQI